MLIHNRKIIPSSVLEAVMANYVITMSHTFLCSNDSHRSEKSNEELNCKRQNNPLPPNGTLPAPSSISIDSLMLWNVITAVFFFFLQSVLTSIETYANIAVLWCYLLCVSFSVFSAFSPCLRWFLSTKLVLYLILALQGALYKTDSHSVTQWRYW